MFSYLLSYPNETLTTNSTTMVLDNGIGIRQLTDLLETGSKYISIIKFGWGTSAFLDKGLLENKIHMIRDYGIKVCPGGTFFELAYLSGNVSVFLEDVLSIGFNCIEISDGTLDIPIEEKLFWIKKAKDKGLVVVSEVGKKALHEDEMLDITYVRNCIKEELLAGAWKVIIEAQESGRRGIFDRYGEIKRDYLEELINGIGIENIIFEAPVKEQQVWLLEQLGPNVNLGNIKPQEVISLATLRKGFRGDTLKKFKMQSVKIYYELGVPGAVNAANRGDVVIVIDTLRASSTIIAGFLIGLNAIIPTASVDECLNKLSAGERGGHKIPGLTFNNSPMELLNNELINKTLYITTTNGTECILTAAKGMNSIVLIGTLLNAKAVAEAAVRLAKKHSKNITILSAGRNNLAAPEDIISATEIGRYIQGDHIFNRVKPIVSKDYFRDFINTETGKNLDMLGYREDVWFCAQKDKYSIVPIFSGDRLIPLGNDN